ncbi:MAG: alpha-mannosidase [Promethearchaeota archaeon]
MEPGTKGPQRIHHGLEHVFEKVLYNRHRKAFQDWCERKNINYYLATWLYRVLQRFLKIPRDAYQVYCIGQSHLDAAWKWTRRDTIRRAILTLKHAADNLDKYPFFTMSMTSPQYYEWVKKFRPGVYERVKEHVKTGRFEFCGGMWVEPDVNLISGESIARQRLLGQRFYLEEFGETSKVAVLSDSFGFPWTLPQLLVKSGAEYFWTNKIAWNDYNKFPLSTFLWRGPDGSEVLTHNFMFNVQGMLYWKDFGRLNRFPKREGVVFNSRSSAEDIEEELGEGHLKSLGFFYGLGDGGAGPLEEEVLLFGNIARRGTFKFCNTLSYFRRIEREMENVPTWDDELYLEYHRGVYTSVEAVKRMNRLCENALHDTELLATLASLVAGVEYPRETLRGAWKLLCFNQFHDILPGSSIQEVYVDAQLDHERILKTCLGIQSRSLVALGEHLDLGGGVRGGSVDGGGGGSVDGGGGVSVDGGGGGGQGMLVVNTLPWTRDDYIHLPDFPIDLDAADMRVVDKGGRELDYQYTFSGLLVEGGPVPASGFSLVTVSGRQEGVEPPVSDLTLVEEGSYILLENEYLRVAVDRVTGFLSSVFSVEQDRELLRGWGNEVRAYTDKPRFFPAWNISKRYTRHAHQIGEPIAVKTLDNGPLQKTVEVQWTHERSFLSMKVALRKGCPMVFFTLDADWKTPRTLLKTNFALAIDSNDVECEIPYGTITRKVTPETEFDRAKWEFPTLRWVDWSDDRGGVTLLNKSKYGYSTSRRGLALTLLRTPPYPRDPYYSTHLFVPREHRSKFSDLKVHHVEYALFVHPGDWRESRAWRAARNYNYPYLVRLLEGGTLRAGRATPKVPAGEPLLSASPPNVVLSAVKGTYDPPDGGNDASRCVLRLYETAGTACTATVNFGTPFVVVGAAEVDLLELDPKEVPVDPTTNAVEVPLGRYEIKTLVVSFGKVGGGEPHA